MFRLVQILWYDLIRFYKHVQTCSNIMTRFDTILQTCPDLFKYYDTIWYDSTNMSRLVQISWYLQTCPDMFKYYDTIWYDSTNMSRLVLNHKMMKYSKIWGKATKKVCDKAIPWTASTSERSKIYFLLYM